VVDKQRKPKLKRDDALQIFEAARQAFNAGDVTGGRQRAEAAIEAFRMVADADGAVVAQNLAGHICLQSGDLQAAFDHFSTARDAAAKGGLEARALTSLGNIAVVLEMRGEVAEAMACHREVLEAQSARGELKGYAIAAGNVGRLAARLGLSDDARLLLQEASEAFKQLEDPAQQANALVCLGDLERAEGRAEEAESTFRDADRLFALARSGTGRALTNVNLGHVYRGLGALDAAAEAYTQALSFSRGATDPEGEARAEHGLGLVALARGDRRDARQHIGRALALHDSTGHVLAAATMRATLSSLDIGDGRFDIARAGLERAFQDFGRCRDLRGQAEILVTLADIDAREGKLEQALRRIEGVIGAPPSQHVYAVARGMAGAILVTFGNLIEGEAMLLEAESLMADGGQTQNRLVAALGRAEVAIVRGRYQAAEQLLGRVRQEAEEMGLGREAALAVRGLATLRREMRLDGEAYRLAEEARAVHVALEEPLETAICDIHACLALARMGEPDVALERAEVALLMLEHAGAMMATYGARSTLGEILLRAGYPDRAAAVLDDAVRDLLAVGSVFEGMRALQRLAVARLRQGDDYGARDAIQHALALAADAQIELPPNPFPSDPVPT